MLILTFLLQLIASPGGDVHPPPRPDWTRKPNMPDSLTCTPRSLAKIEALVTLRCVTAPNDHVKDCKVLSNTDASHVGFESAALCASKYFRISAKGPDGPVMDVPVNVPVGFLTPTGYQAMVNEIRSHAYRRPPDGTVDEVTIVRWER